MKWATRTHGVDKPGIPYWALREWDAQATAALRQTFYTSRKKLDEEN
jgi:hypothetical protein